jgi:hypothetical protein
MTIKTLTRWIPKSVTIEDIFRIIANYGTNNDTLSIEKYDENIIPVKITITVEKLSL